MKKNVFIGLLIGSVLYASGIVAQVADSLLSIQYVRHQNAWIEESNPAGLVFTPVKKISFAKIYANKDNGGFRNYYQSDDSFLYGAGTESYYRHNNKVVMYGAISYANFKGKNMEGSAFINPYTNPIGIEENADTTYGTKQLEQYHLTAAVAVKLLPKLSLGAKLNFEAANYAKRKDLRHNNKLLNMNIEPGLVYDVNNRFKIGIAYGHTRRIESYTFSIEGNTDRQYLSLINFGSFLGRTEVFGGFGYTSANSISSTTYPYVNKTNSLSLQLAYQLAPNIDFYNEISFGKLNGYLGDEGSNSVVFANHRSALYGYRVVLGIRHSRSFQRVSVKAEYQDLTNHENVWDRISVPGGGSIVQYYGHNKVLDKQLLSIGGQYTGYFQLQGNTPVWEWNTKADFFRRQQTTTLYPFYRIQNINAYSINTSVDRNFIKPNEIYTASVLLGYGAGTGNAKSDGLFVPPAASQVPPKSRDKYLFEEYEYYTSPRVEIALGFKYTKPISGILIFFRLDYALTKAFQTTYLSSPFTSIKATIGCSF